MSDTPRTDAAIFAVDVAFVSHDGLASEPKEVVEPEFARQLEHENVALRADVLEQCMLIAKGSEREYSLRGRIEQLERENAALRAADQIDISALRRENAALRSLIDDPNAMHSHYLRECNGWEVWQAERIRRFQDASEQLEQLERENAALRRYRNLTTPLIYDLGQTMAGAKTNFDIFDLAFEFSVKNAEAINYIIDAARAKEAKP